jgi:hypothetical protein
MTLLCGRFNQSSDKKNLQIHLYNFLFMLA